MKNTTYTRVAAGGSGPLSSAQQTAIECLAAGESVVSTAKAAGVSRSTIHRWMGRDGAFRTVWSARRAAEAEAFGARMKATVERAASVRVPSAGAGLKAAMRMFERMGPMVSPTDPSWTAGGFPAFSRKTVEEL